LPDVAHELQEAIQRHAGLWKALRAKRIVVAAGRTAEGAFHRKASLAGEAQRLADAEVHVRAFEELCGELERKHPSESCLIDVLQAMALVKEQQLASAEAILRSRVRYQGTDGVRGKVAEDDETATALTKLSIRGEFTPGLSELLCAGLLLRRGETKPPTVVLAEDGRDAATAALRGRGLLIEQWDIDDIECDEADCGAKGSPTRVKNVDSVQLVSQDHRRIEPTPEGLGALVKELIEEHIVD